MTLRNEVEKTMRFWKGVIGCVLGVLSGMLAGGYVAGTVGAMLDDLAILFVFVVLLAGFGSLMLDDAEAEDSFRRHLQTGAVSIGGLMMGIFVVSYMILPSGFPWFSLREFIMALAFSAFVGASGGLGFYSLTRNTRK